MIFPTICTLLLVPMLNTAQSGDAQLQSVMTKKVSHEQEDTSTQPTKTSKPLRKKVTPIKDGVKDTDKRKEPKPTKKRKPKDPRDIAPSKGIRQTNLEEAVAAKDYYIRHDDPNLAAKYLERALSLAKDHNKREELTLELADLYLSLEKRDKASILYSQFKTLYPGSDQIKHVHFKELEATFHDTQVHTRDQSKTKATVKLAKQFLEEFPEDTTYKKRVEDMRLKAYFLLILHELGIAEFYISKYTYKPQENFLKAARRRLAYIIREYLPHIPNSSHLLSKEDQMSSTNNQALQQELQEAIDTIRAVVNKEQSSIDQAAIESIKPPSKKE